MRLSTAEFVLAVAAAVMGGCKDAPFWLTPAEERRTARARVEELTQENLRLQADLAERDKEVQSLREKVGRLRGFGDGRLKRITHVERIKLGKHTGGVDLDDAAGHDGIKVYLMPVDRHGSTIKAAGEAKIQLFDLVADEGGRLLGEYAWSVDDMPQQWSSGFLVYHYSFLCPWKSGKPPARDQITVRVEFVDYLTGDSFSAQKLCKVDLPPTGSLK